MPILTGPLDEITLENIFHKWCQDVTGLQFIIANQSTNPPRPQNTYGTVMLGDFLGTELNEIAYEAHQYDNDIDKIVMIRPTVALSVNIYGDGGKTAMLKLKASVWNSIVKDYFVTNRVGFVEHSAIRSIPRLTHESNERRAQCDFTFNLIGDYTTVLNTIGTVEIESGLDGREIIVSDTYL